MQDKAISGSFSQGTGTNVLDDKIPALATVNCVYLWYPIQAQPLQPDTATDSAQLNISFYSLWQIQIFFP